MYCTGVDHSYLVSAHRQTSSERPANGALTSNSQHVVYEAVCGKAGRSDSPHTFSPPYLLLAHWCCSPWADGMPSPCQCQWSQPGIVTILPSRTDQHHFDIFGLTTSDRICKQWQEYSYCKALLIVHKSRPDGSVSKDLGGIWLYKYLTFYYNGDLLFDQIGSMYLTIEVRWLLVDECDCHFSFVMGSSGGI